MFRIFYSIEALLAGLFLLPFVTSEWEYKILRSTLDKDKEKHAIDLIKEKIGKPDATYNTIAQHLTTSFDKSHPSETNNHWWCVATGPAFSIIGLGPIVNSIQLSMRFFASLHPHEMHITLMELKFGRDINLNQDLKSAHQNNPKTFVDTLWEFEITNSTLDKDKETHAINLIKEKIGKPDATYNTIATHLTTSFDKSHPPDTNNRWWCVVTGPVFSIGGHIPIANSIQLSVRDKSLHPHEVHITLIELKFGRDIDLNQEGVAPSARFGWAPWLSAVVELHRRAPNVTKLACNQIRKRRDSLTPELGTLGFVDAETLPACSAHRELQNELSHAWNTVAVGQL
ncbi:hypothetical protein Ddc_19617 [Ditylenchus destructor]|nr:hypothetical protein Ddc_19617 [Ditylenchus destructor]